MYAQEAVSDVGELPVLQNDLVISKGARRHVLRLVSRNRTNDPILTDAMMREHGCIRLGTVVAMWNDLQAGRLVQVLPDWHLKQTPAIYARHTFRATIPTKSKVFLEFVEELGRGTWQTSDSPLPSFTTPRTISPVESYSTFPQTE